MKKDHGQFFSSSKVESYFDNFSTAEKGHGVLTFHEGLSDNLTKVQEFRYFVRVGGGYQGYRHKRNATQYAISP